MSSSYTTWVRIEPTAAVDEIEVGLQARVADPYWMLARQWQMGEFRGEDAATPIHARVLMERTRLDRVRLHDLEDDGALAPTVSTPRLLDLGDEPLEALVEREVVAGIADPQRGLEAGAQLLARISAMEGAREDIGREMRQAFRAAFPLQPWEELRRDEVKPAIARQLDALAGRAVDGAALYAGVVAAGEDLVPAALTVRPGLKAIAKDLLGKWKQWYESRFEEPESTETAWKRERMEYAFSVSGPARDHEVVLDAPEHLGGHLDWYSFDVSAEDSLDGAPRTGDPDLQQVDVIPTPLRYPGMPASRFWEFEDRQVHLARYTAGAGEALKYLLIEYAMVYGDDWFRLPVKMEVGDLARVDSLRVWDNFGGTTDVKPMTQLDGDGAWRLFVMDGDPALDGGEASSRGGGVEKGPWLLRPPSLARNLSGPALEEVVFTRDEMANLAWAIERKVEAPVGQSLSRAEMWTANRRVSRQAVPVSEESEVEVPKYRIQSGIPDFWVPLVPVRYRRDGVYGTVGGDNESIILRRGSFLQPDGSESPPAQGRLLDARGESPRPLLLFEEELPRNGITVTVRWQLARWLDGSTRLWLNRVKDHGQGERSSGLDYDRVEE